jgi:hypothetical protein
LQSEHNCTRLMMDSLAVIHSFFELLVSVQGKSALANTRCVLNLESR